MARVQVSRCIIIIDPGSNISFLTNKVAIVLKAKHISFAIPIKGLVESHANTNNVVVCVGLLPPGPALGLKSHVLLCQIENYCQR